MPGLVHVVTDSTAGLSADEVTALGVSVVPLTVTAGTVSGLEGVDVQPSDVVCALRSRAVVTTSQPSPGAFVAAYERNEPVVSIHLSGLLSGTCDAARRAARAAPGRIHVVDSESVSVGLAFAVRAAAAAAARGGTAQAVIEAARVAQHATTVFFCVDDLDFLRRGGRIGPAAALVGSVLAVKPLLRLRAGAVVVEERVRTGSRAVMRLAELACEAAPGGVAEIAVAHLDAQERAAQLAHRLAELVGPEAAGVPAYERVPVSHLTAAVAAHAGPGAFGLAVRHR